MKKWKSEVDRYQQGMIPIAQHRNTISELRERWAEETNDSRSTERIEGVEEVQVHAKGERPTVHSFPRNDEL